MVKPTVISDYGDNKPSIPASMTEIIARNNKLVLQTHDGLIKNTEERIKWKKIQPKSKRHDKVDGQNDLTKRTDFTPKVALQKTLVYCRWWKWNRCLKDAEYKFGTTIQNDFFFDHHRQRKREIFTTTQQARNKPRWGLILLASFCKFLESCF